MNLTATITGLPDPPAPTPRSLASYIGDAFATGGPPVLAASVGASTIASIVSPLAVVRALRLGSVLGAATCSTPAQAALNASGLLPPPLVDGQSPAVLLRGLLGRATLVSSDDQVRQQPPVLELPLAPALGGGALEKFKGALIVTNLGLLAALLLYVGLYLRIKAPGISAGATRAGAFCFALPLRATLRYGVGAVSPTVLAYFGPSVVGYGVAVAAAPDALGGSPTLGVVSAALPVLGAIALLAVVAVAFGRGVDAERDYIIARQIDEGAAISDASVTRTPSKRPRFRRRATRGDDSDDPEPDAASSTSSADHRFADDPRKRRRANGAFRLWNRDSSDALAEATFHLVSHSRDPRERACRVYPLVELLVACFTAAVQPIALAGTCTGGLAAIALANVALLVYAVVVRPYRRLVDQVFVMLTNTGVAVAAVVAAAAGATGSSDALQALGYGSLGVAGTLLLAPIAAAGWLLQRCLAKRRTSAAVLEGPDADDGRSTPSIQRPLLLLPGTSRRDSEVSFSSSYEFVSESEDGAAPAIDAGPSSPLGDHATAAVKPPRRSQGGDASAVAPDALPLEVSYESPLDNPGLSRPIYAGYGFPLEYVAFGRSATRFRRPLHGELETLQSPPSATERAWGW